MLNELRKSINAALYERTSSPLFGTFFASWSVINWKIIYLTLFDSESKANGAKINYILDHYFNVHHLITYPLISTVVLLTLVPFATNGSYWLHLKFSQWRQDKKHDIEKSQRLTIEQSLKIKVEIAKQMANFEKLIADKDAEINSQKREIHELRNGQPFSKDEDGNFSLDLGDLTTSNPIDEVTEKILSHDKLSTQAEYIFECIQDYREVPDDIAPNVIGFFIANELITRISKADNYYEFTDKGKKVYKQLLDQEF